MAGAPRPALQKDMAANLTQSGPIDRVHLAQQCLGDAGLEREILRLFRVTIDTYLERLQAAETHEDLVANLHAIRSASSGVGAWSLLELAAAAEATLSGHCALSPEAVADIDMAVEEARVYIDTILDDAA